MPPKALSRFAERGEIGGHRHRRARWTWRKELHAWGVDGPPGATGGALRPRRPKTGVGIVRSINEVIHLIQGCHCALLQKVCKMPKSQTLDP